jgi:hypothetical protein
MYHKESNYEKLNTIGVDVNFNKHWNHGVEIRFFDWFPDTRLQGVIRFLVYLADVASEFTRSKSSRKSLFGMRGWFALFT